MAGLKVRAINNARTTRIVLSIRSSLKTPAKAAVLKSSAIDRN